VARSRPSSPQAIALGADDIKRVLAYSTVSQLGYMFLALGVGAYWVAIFHLFTHAFFKALLFLCSGSVIHAMGGEQDMRRMGALKDKIPTTHWTMWVGSVPSRAFRAWRASSPKTRFCGRRTARAGSKLLWFVGLATAGLTAFYMWRLMNMTFYGKSHVAPEVAKHVHESPASMTVPLTLLAIGSVLAGWLGTPKLWNLPESFRAFERWLQPSFASAAVETAQEGAHNPSAEWMLMGLSVAVAIIGIAVARYFYNNRPSIPIPSKAMQAAVYRALQQMVRDEIYDFLFVNGLGKGGGRVCGAFDRNVVDGGVNGAGWLTRFTSRVSIWWDTWIIDGAVRFGSFSVKMLSYRCVHPRNRARPGVRILRGGGGVGVSGYYIAR